MQKTRFLGNVHFLPGGGDGSKSGGLRKLLMAGRGVQKFTAKGGGLRKVSGNNNI